MDNNKILKLNFIRKAFLNEMYGAFIPQSVHVTMGKQYLLIKMGGFSNNSILTFSFLYITRKHLVP